MAKGNEIIVSADPKGTFMEGIISGTPTPGICVQIKASVAPVSGRFTFEAVTRADGAKGPIFVLLPDQLQGKIGVGAALGTNLGHAVGDAYVSGTRCFVYAPIAGEDLNLVALSVAGTADDVAIGALFGVDQNTGKILADNSFASAPFQALEVITDPTTDYMLWVKYLGNNA